MKSVGAFEAKTHFSSLLERVSRGETIAITRRGVPTAILSPIDATRSEIAERAVRTIRETRAGVRPGKMTIREMIDEGRRF